jgi:hypothetical protein
MLYLCVGALYMDLVSLNPLFNYTEFHAVLLLLA